MEIIDGQLHEPGVHRFWRDTDDVSRRMAFTEVLSATLAAVGVDGAVLHPIEDTAWAHSLADRIPDRFAVVPMVARPIGQASGWQAIDPDAPDVEEHLAAAVARPGCVALRFAMVMPGDIAKGLPVRDERAFRFCETHRVPVLSPFARRPEHAGIIARAFPELTIVVDQMALETEVLRGADPWARLPETLDLAQYPNVHLKLTGMPSLSHDSYPYLDLRPYVSRLLDAFGAARCMWASDISYYRGQIGSRNRFPQLIGSYPGKHTYAQAVGFWRDADWLDADTKADLLGRSARRIFRWPAP